ncbi:MAG: glycosyltransferase family 2 protein [Myxococcota bacterium]
MRVLGVIVNYRTPDLTIRAIDSGRVELQRLGRDCRLVVVDNDSGDGSLGRIRAHVQNRGWGDHVAVVGSGRNGGFAFGNNVAIRAALASGNPPDFFYVQNSDAFPEPGALERLVRHMDANPRVGIAGSYTHGMDGEPHRTAFRFPTVAGELEAYARLGPVSRALRRHIVAFPIPQRTTEVDWVAGASMLVRRRVFEEVGLFDERYFLYFEETDLCLRARRAGWTTLYVRDSTVAHVGSASTGLWVNGRRMPAYWFDSRRHYFRKNHGVTYLWLSNAALLLGSGIFRTRRAIERYRADDEPQRFIRDFVAHTIRRDDVAA